MRRRRSSRVGFGGPPVPPSSGRDVAQSSSQQASGQAASRRLGAGNHRPGPRSIGLVPTDERWLNGMTTKQPHRRRCPAKYSRSWMLFACSLGACVSCGGRFAGDGSLSDENLRGDVTTAGPGADTSDASQPPLVVDAALASPDWDGTTLSILDALYADPDAGDAGATGPGGGSVDGEAPDSRQVGMLEAGTTSCGSGHRPRPPWCAFRFPPRTRQRARRRRAGAQRRVGQVSAGPYREPKIVQPSRPNAGPHPALRSDPTTAGDRAACPASEPSRRIHVPDDSTHFPC
jgi:hypothetical protein